MGRFFAGYDCYTFCTMGGILGSGRIVLAAVFSSVLILGAYFLAKSFNSASVAQASPEAALLRAIAAKDADGDRLPDWEESLYGTDPAKYDSRSLGMSDGDAVRNGLIVPKAIVEASSAGAAGASSPAGKSALASAEGSLTAAFSQNLFSLYVAAKDARGGGALSQADMDSVIDQALGDLSRSVITAPDFKNAGDLRIQGTGKDRLVEFAIAGENLMRFHTVQATTSETVYLSRALEGDSSATQALDSIAKGYRVTATGLAALSVPQEVAEADLLLINALMRLGGIIGDFARVHDDPLTTVLALHQYGDAVQKLVEAIIAVDASYARAGVKISPNEPGFSFAHLRSVVFDSQP